MTTPEPPGADAPLPGPGELAVLYLGNILYALELAALSLDAQGKGDEAAFYRGIGRQLAEAHRRTRAAG